jgi:hypothetical protein
MPLEMPKGMLKRAHCVKKERKPRLKIGKGGGSRAVLPLRRALIGPYLLVTYTDLISFFDTNLHLPVHGGAKRRFKSYHEAAVLILMMPFYSDRIMN